MKNQNYKNLRPIIGLRFAGVAFLPLLDIAIKENFSEKDIKKRTNRWRGDYYRV